MSENARFQKILKLAVNPAAQEGEAQAAFGRLRELARLYPHLTAPAAPPPMPPPAAAKAEENTVHWRLTKIAPFWFAIAIDNLSRQGYRLGLRCQFACDFKERPTALDITCTGSKDACDLFGQTLAFLIDYINSQRASPKKS
jgi:hypothetical protein